MTATPLGDAYAHYVQNDLIPLRVKVETLFDEWRSGSPWPAQDSANLTIPSPIHRTYTRIKRLESLEDKLKRLSIDDSVGGEIALTQVHDVFGARIVAYVSNNIPLIDRLIRESDQLKISQGILPKCYLSDETVERLNLDREKFAFLEKKSSGYASVHYILEYVDSQRTYPRFELQVRTMLSEAWGEIEHKFAYKSDTYAEVGVRRQLRVVADHLQAIDAHFDLVQDRLQYLRNNSDPKDSDDLDEVNIARICADVEVPLKEDEAVPLVGILYDHEFTSVGQLRSRIPHDVVTAMKREMNAQGENLWLTALHLISTAVLLKERGSPEDAVKTLRERLLTAEVSKMRKRPRGAR